MNTMNVKHMAMRMLLVLSTAYVSMAQTSPTDDEDGDIPSNGTACRKWFWDHEPNDNNPKEYLESFCEDWQLAVNIGIVLVITVVVVSVLIAVAMKVLGLACDVFCCTLESLCCVLTCGLCCRSRKHDDPLLSDFDNGAPRAIPVNMA